MNLIEVLLPVKNLFLNVVSILQRKSLIPLEIYYCEILGFRISSVSKTLLGLSYSVHGDIPVNSPCSWVIVLEEEKKLYGKSEFLSWRWYIRGPFAN